MKNYRQEFLIGASTAAHQVEGNNIHSDFWTLEHLDHSSFVEPSLDACDHYNRYEEDIDLLKGAGCNAYRFSLEWARIEPDKGVFSEEAINHYKEVLTYCHKTGITPVVTLHHFSSPKWLISEGGWESRKTVDFFSRYTTYVVEQLGDLMPYICTINEANMGVQIGRIMKKYYEKMMKAKASNPDVQVGLNIQGDKEKSAFDIEVEEAFGIPNKEVQHFLAPRTEEGDQIIIECHKAAREVIKESGKNIKVGITMSLYDYQSIPGGEDYIAKRWEEDLMHYMPYLKDDDFLGVQNYTRKIYGPEGEVELPEGTKMTEMGNEYYPQSIAGVLRYVSKHWDKEIMVTENGISTKDDSQRVSFINEAMAGIEACLDEGIKLLGYMHWSLMDNFEWQKGYDQQFGLIAVDRSTQERFPKESLKVLGSYKQKL